MQNETAGIPSPFHNSYMAHKKHRKKPDIALYASVKKEMAQPRMAKSSRIAELNLETERISEQPSTTMAGTVDRIIPSPRRSLPEKAQIALEGADQQYQGFRIDNTLTDEHGDDVKLKKGANVDVTVIAKDFNGRK